MKTPFTRDHIRKSACGHLNQHILKTPNSRELKKEPGRRVVFKKRSKELDYMGWNLLYWCNEKAVVLEEEYHFNPDRKWRSDWAIPALKLLIEYEGGIFMDNGGHNSVAGISRDIEKYQSAQQLGWKVIRFTAVNYKTLITELNKHL